jgi:hypothetical protein
MNEIVSFRDAINLSAKYKKSHLLIGNGFSIDCDPTIFTYRSLYEPACETHTQYMQAVKTLVSRREAGATLDITFYDAASANVWGRLNG